METMSKIKIDHIRDNSGKRVEVFTGLTKGDKLKAKHTLTALDDIGMSGQTFRYESFIAGKIYEVYHTYFWGFTWVAYVSDESGSLAIATPDIFEII